MASRRQKVPITRGMYYTVAGMIASTVGLYFLTKRATTADRQKIHRPEGKRIEDLKLDEATLKRLRTVESYNPGEGISDPSIPRRSKYEGAGNSYLRDKSDIDPAST